MLRKEVLGDFTLFCRWVGVPTVLHTRASARMTSDTHDRGLNMPPSSKWFNQPDVWLLICYNCPCHLDLAAGENAVWLLQHSPYAPHSPSNENSGPLLVRHQLLAESKTNDIRWGPLGRTAHGH